MSRHYLLVGEVVFVAILCTVAVALFRQHAAIPDAVRADVKLVDFNAQLYLRREPGGQYRYFLWHPGGDAEEISANQLAGQLYSKGQTKGVASFLGGSSTTILFWLGVGLFGQILFTGRMVVQWIASERKGSSIVPPTFWWMSLAGSLLLLAYFMWRRDPIGLLGQAFGSFIYLRNILWILEGKRPTPLATAEATEPMTQG